MSFIKQNDDNAVYESYKVYGILFNKVIELMSKKLKVIYVPGLGDANPSSQIKVIRLWRLWGVKAELCHMNWADSESWTSKLDKLLKKIDDAHAAGYKVGLVGASAGAGAVINAFALRKDIVAGCVLISGKVNSPHTIGQSYHRKNPSFIDSANDVMQSLEKLNKADRQRILSRYALADEVVVKHDSFIKEAHNHQVPTVGHFFTIATQLIFGAPSFLFFLKRQHI